VERNRGLIKLQSAFYPTLTFCLGASALLVLWFGGRDVMTGRLTLGEFVAVSRSLVLLSWPLIAFGWVINLVQRGVASWERMLEVFDVPPVEEARASHQVAIPARRGRIEARHLTFAYPGSPANALEDVWFVLIFLSAPATPFPCPMASCVWMPLIDSRMAPVSASIYTSRIAQSLRTLMR
jgi:ATP-binding cassette subfamily B protein